MTEGEARAVVAALDKQWKSPRSDAYERERQEQVERYWAEEVGGDWVVYLFWSQWDRRFGLRVSRVIPVAGEATAEVLALDLRQLWVEEPHSTDWPGKFDSTGRYWFEDEIN